MTIGEIPEFLLFQEHDVFAMLLAVNVPFTSLQLIIRMSSCMVSGGVLQEGGFSFHEGKEKGRITLNASETLSRWSNLQVFHKGKKYNLPALSKLN